MSLPTAWIDRIFDKLTLVYGRAFLDRWRDLDLNAVKSDWGHELAGLAQHPHMIAHGLQTLNPDRAPTVLEFRALCRRAPEAQAERLPAPRADPARVAEELAKLAPMRQAPAVDHKAWARSILARQAAGDRPSRISVQFAKEALA